MLHNDFDIYTLYSPFPKQLPTFYVNFQYILVELNKDMMNLKYLQLQIE